VKLEPDDEDTTVYDYSSGSWNPVYVKDLTTGLINDVVFANGFRIGRVQGAVKDYYHLDRMGSVRLVTQTQNLQPFTAKYLPYGNTYATSGTENFQYTGKQLDMSTGLVYYGHRYYDSQSGRFLTADAAGPNYVNPQSLNQYVYALDNPNLYIDLTGATYGLPYGVDWYSKRYASKEQLEEEGLETYGNLTPAEAKRAIETGLTVADILGETDRSSEWLTAAMNFAVYGRMFPNLAVQIGSPASSTRTPYVKSNAITNPGFSTPYGANYSNITPTGPTMQLFQSLSCRTDRNEGLGSPYGRRNRCVPRAPRALKGRRELNAQE
jgi:RHS repeat-associated protein